MYESWVIQEICDTPESKIFAKRSSNASPWLKTFFNLEPLKQLIQLIEQNFAQNTDRFLHVAHNTACNIKCYLLRKIVRQGFSCGTYGIGYSL